jgi:thiosulfate reductase cytochrome b subunit
MLVERHALPVRLWHWITAAAVFALLLTGVVIFNVHPRLYWGEVGNATLPAAIGIEAPPGADLKAKPVPAILRVGSHTWDLTGYVGLSVGGGEYFMIYRSPRFFMKFGAARAWHFVAAWVLALGWIGYVAYLFASRRLARDLLPTREQITARAALQDLWNHLRLHRARGEEAGRYNLLQKLTYLAIVFVIVPLAILTGLTMSNAITARFPELYALFGGRESARTLHGIMAALLFLFIVVHIFQLFVAGFGSKVRGMITGKIDPAEQPS